MMKVGILGAGSIAETMTKTIANMEDVEVSAVGAREYDRAKAFAKKFEIEKAYGSYEDLVNDSELDLIYIATPHSHHYKHTKLCLEHNKNVLCEKAFMVNANQAQELFDLAKEKGLLLTEAIWTRYMPSRAMIDEVIASGAIGTPTSLIANLGYNISHVERMLKPELAGGALLDLGVYTLHFASMVFGNDVKKITSAVSKLETGVDGMNSITLEFQDGKLAVLHSNMLSGLDRRAVIYGTKGYLEIQNLNNPEKLTVFDKGYQEVATYYPPKQITGYEYQVIACKEALEKGKVECEAIPHTESLHIMKQMDEIRAQWGYEIPSI